MIYSKLHDGIFGAQAACERKAKEDRAALNTAMAKDMVAKWSRSQIEQTMKNEKGRKEKMSERRTKGQLKRQERERKQSNKSKV